MRKLYRYFIFLLFMAPFLSARAGSGQWLEFTSFGAAKAYLEDDKELWIGTSGGLVRVDKASGSRTVYTKFNSGLPSNVIETIKKNEHDESIWIGTYDAGLAFYDGKKWTSITAENSMLPSNSVMAIEMDEQGNNWVGTTKGLVKISKNGGWTIYNRFNSGLQDDKVWCMSRSADGKLWLGCGFGIYAFDGANWEDHSKIVSAYGINSLWCDEQNRTLVATTGGAFEYNAGAWKKLGDPSAGVSLYQATGILRDKEGALWVSTQYQGVFKQESATWKAFNPANQNFPAGSVISLHQSLSGEMLAGTDKGLLRLEQDGWKKWQVVEDGLPDQNIKGAISDGLGGIWAITAFGVSRHADGKWQTFTPQNSVVPSTFFTSICQGRKGEIWIAGQGGVSCWSNGQWKVYDTAEIAAGISYLYDIAADDNGTVWLCHSQGLSRLTNGMWESMELPFTLDMYETVTKLTTDTKGNLWAATYRGQIACLSGNTWKHVFSAANGTFPADNIMHIATDGNNRIWAAIGNGGIYYLDGGQWTIHAKTTQGNLKGIATAFGNHIWTGSSSPAGLARTDIASGQITSLNSPLPEGEILWLKSDRSGNLFVGTNKGLVVYNEAGINWTNGIQDSKAHSQSTITSKGIVTAGENAIANLSLQSSGQMQWQVYDLQGRVVYQVPPLQFLSGNHTLVWPTAGLKPGMYILKATIDGRSMPAQKVVIQ